MASSRRMRLPRPYPAVTAAVLAALLVPPGLRAQETDKEKYAKRFLEMYDKIKDPKSGYFAPMGMPYHSIETLIIEAPDQGHETTSEAVSYWLWLEGMYGFMTNQWQGVANVWDKAEKYIIPTHADQPTNDKYDASKPATFIPEYDAPSQYPAALDPGKAPGPDPLAAELRSAYGTNDVYGMHWLLDVDDWYGYGNRADGISKPSYINTFERGSQESVWEAIPHPSWDAFKFGGRNGFLDLFVKDSKYARQWRYTDAPDADARMIQAMYWVYLWAKEKGQAASALPVDKAAKLGDYLRYALFDKYFRNLECTGSPCNSASDYPNAHYLFSWYYGWGGAADVNEGWAYRIGASHNHFGYQNPVAAYALGNSPDFKGKSPNAARDWGRSYERQMEFYQWLQSAEGAFAGGATSSIGGRYDPKPAGVPQFYGMPYQENPVYLDPGSNTWFGWQAWSTQRLGEIFFINGDARAEKMMDKWIAWAKKETRLFPNGTWAIPSEIAWQGQPDEWKGWASFTGNPGLHVSVKSYTMDVGISASLARTLIHYAHAKRKYRGKADDEAIALAKGILDRMWDTYRDAYGISAPEQRGDYKRLLTQEVYVPAGWSGTMANGDAIHPGVTFLDIRSKYRQDPAFARVKAALDAGKDPEFRYHRFWAQVEVALALGELARFSQDNPNVAPIVVAPGPNLNPDYTGTVSPGIGTDTGDPKGPGVPDVPKPPIAIREQRPFTRPFAAAWRGGKIALSWPGAGQTEYAVELRDVGGAVALQRRGTGTGAANLDRGSLPAGIYACSLRAGDRVFRTRLLLP